MRCIHLEILAFVVDFVDLGGVVCHLRIFLPHLSAIFPGFLPKSGMVSERLEERNGD